MFDDRLSDILDTYWDEIRKGERLVTSIQATAKREIKQAVADCVIRNDYPVDHLQNEILGAAEIRNDEKRQMRIALGVE